MFSKKKLLSQISERDAEIRDLRQQLNQVREARDNAANATQFMNIQLEEWQREQREEILSLCDTLGISVRDMDGVRAEVRSLRLKAQRYDTIKSVMHDGYDADVGLVKRLAASLGTSAADVDSLIRRAGMLAQVNTRNRDLQVRLNEALAKVDELDEENTYDEFGR